MIAGGGGLAGLTTAGRVELATVSGSGFKTGSERGPTKLNFGCFFKEWRQLFLTGSRRADVVLTVF